MRGNLEFLTGFAWKAVLACPRASPMRHSSDAVFGAIQLRVVCVQQHRRELVGEQHVEADIPGGWSVSE